MKLVWCLDRVCSLVATACPLGTTALTSPPAQVARNCSDDTGAATEDSEAVLAATEAAVDAAFSSILGEEEEEEDGSKPVLRPAKGPGSKLHLVLEVRGCSGMLIAGLEGNWQKCIYRSACIWVGCATCQFHVHQAHMVVCSTSSSANAVRGMILLQLPTA